MLIHRLAVVGSSVYNDLRKMRGQFCIFCILRKFCVFFARIYGLLYRLVGTDPCLSC